MQLNRSVVVLALLSSLFARSAMAQAFAITKQISPINLADPALVELTSLSKLPLEVTFVSLTTPTGVKLLSQQTSDCASVTTAGADCRERFAFNLDAVTSKKCNLTGSYVAKFQLTCRAGMTGTCTAGPKEVPFSLQSENFCTETTANTSQAWSPLNGLMGNDVGIGSGPQLFLIDVSQAGNDFGIIRYDTARAVGMRLTGGAVRSDAGSDSTPWVVNAAGEIYRGDGSSNWTRVTGPAATDIGVGANGSVWILDNATVQGGHKIYKYTGSGWTLVPGGAVRIDVDPQGNPWVVASDGGIYKWNGSGWDRTPGAARDVGISSNGSVFVIGTAGDVYKWNGSGWTARGGSNFTAITVSANGVPMTVDASHAVWVGQP